MDIIQANIDRFKLLLTTEPCNGKAGVVTSQSHGSAPDEIVDRSKFSFNGTANAIRRQALPQLREVFAGRDQRKLRLLDLGCGTGRFLDSVKQVWPRLPTVGLDMSEAYIRHAKSQLKCQ